MFGTKPSSAKAFSLIELSVVILIIGILVAGVMVGNRLIDKSRLLAAESLTKSSPVAGIRDNAVWLETSLSDSIDSSQASNGAAITAWNNQSVAVTKPTIVAVSGGPTYANTINRVHAIKFSGAGYLQISDASFLNGSNYTIVVLEKRLSTSSGYFIGDSTVTTANQTLLLGYGSDGTLTHSQGSGNSYDSQIVGYSASKDVARVMVFISDVGVGKKTYINGVLSASNNNTNTLSNISTLAIGKGYNGEIGELMIFTRALTNEERKSIEDYLSKKWSSKILRDAVVGGSCINGTITSAGCSKDCSTSSILGVTSPTVVTDGQSGVSATCGATGYTGSVTVSCPAGTGIISASGSCVCDTANGYQLNAGSCQKTCVVPAGSGTTLISVFSGTTSTTCDASGYVGMLQYTCNTSGNFNITLPCQPLCTASPAVTPDTTTVAGAVIFKFTTVGTYTFNCPAAVTSEVLVVGGGGGGGGNGGGGGGAGGVIYSSASNIASGTSYTVVVGAGGNGGINVAPSTLSGGDSSINISGIATAVGGGGGASRDSGGAAANGGSGGGGAGGINIANSTAGSGSPTASQGNGGGSGTGIGGTDQGCNSAGGGGGGATSSGANAANQAGGNGGAGYTSAISGVAGVVYGSGGGGGRTCNSGGTAGIGGTGAGNGGFSGSSGATNATGYGSGGGGGNGKSGIVIVRYGTHS